ncbi:hypothetical protein GEV33_013083 [Tenebrio molitor]|uniref:CUB domain-containing protein n=1 Tax=Tenebrio molitor TaxID=7067 RepID=A0A8J6L7M0_TENMO|nr:hypothetical protein GEV33_013083 [Tenebrio molitor]
MKRVSVRLSVGSGLRKGPSAAASTPNPDRKCSRFRWKRTWTFRRAEKAIPGRGINRRMMTGPGRYRVTKANWCRMDEKMVYKRATIDHCAYTAAAAVGKSIVTKLNSKNFRHRFAAAKPVDSTKLIKKEVSLGICRAAFLNLCLAKNFYFFFKRNAAGTGVIHQAKSDTIKVITSPEFMSTYEWNRFEENSRARAPEGHIIKLDFRDYFEIEQSNNCEHDFLEVRNGQHGYNDRIERKFCGNEFPPMIQSSDRYLWIHFKSDENIEYRGFRAVFEFVPRPSGCKYQG